MSVWPSSIPYDLECEILARDATDWESALRAWAKTHQLRLKVQWFAELARTMAELDGYRFTPAAQDRWVRIKEWMEAYGVPALPNLPTRPELSGPMY